MHFCTDLDSHKLPNMCFQAFTNHPPEKDDVPKENGMAGRQTQGEDYLDMKKSREGLPRKKEISPP
eukprot:c12679_g1_i1 orf=20-217(-)